MKRLIGKIAIMAVLATPLAVALPAQADNVGPITFEAYALGNINGQFGWNALGSAGSGCAIYDEDVASSLGTSGFGAQSFRISDAVTSGCFGDQAFAPPVVNAAGEADSTDGTFSPGILQPHFEMQFDIASTQFAQQPGMHTSVSPDRGDGSRMSYLRFEDGVAGIDVFFDDVQGTSNPANFVETQIATGLSRAVPHTVKLSIDFINGPSNDVVKVWIDGVLVHTGTSWENYYRYDSEASAEQSPRIVKTVLFRESGAANPSDAGKGFLFDNMSLSSGPIPPITVTLVKYVDGNPATAISAGDSSFPMTSTWDAANIGAGTGSFSLGPTGFNNPNPYQATTADMASGASYGAAENVPTTCMGSNPYELAGYTAGASLAEAAGLTPTLAQPNFTNITQNEYVIVWNRNCLPAPTPLSPPNGTVTTTAGLTSISWNPVTDPAGGITYVYQSSNSSATNSDGSFVSPAYTSGALTATSIPTLGTPAGTYFWHVQATDADGNVSPWSTMWEVTVSNPPTAMNQCKNGGWEIFINPAFNNQGDCVSYVASGGKAKGNP